MASAAAGTLVSSKKEVCLWITHSGRFYDPYFNLNRAGHEGNVFKFVEIDEAIKIIGPRADVVVKEIYLEANIGASGRACNITLEVVSRLQEAFPENKAIRLFSPGTDGDTLDGDEKAISVLKEAYPDLITLSCGAGSAWYPRRGSQFGRPLQSPSLSRESSMSNRSESVAPGSPSPDVKENGSYLFRPIASEKEGGSAQASADKDS